MPVAKKTHRKTPIKSHAKAEAASPLPDLRAMESFLAAIAGSRTASRADDASAKAQDLVYAAWEEPSPRKRVALARKALSVSPLCADALNILAEAAGSAAEARDLYSSAVDAATLILGPEAFHEYAGHFWGFLETRPYMRARAGLAGALHALGEEDAAIGHYRDMLKLNPNDNQGIRYVLAACLLRREAEPALKELLGQYPDEASTVWLYTRALMTFRDGHADDVQAIARVKAAWAENKHVPAILTGTKRPTVARDGYLMVGGPDEASLYVADFGLAWHRTTGAVAWLTRLTRLTATLPRSRSALN
jgi:tetratricopeptide (TPR) repeat protein